MKDTVSHYVPPHSPLTSTEPPQVFSNNLTMPVKVPANEEHSLTNTGDEDLVFLVIYDPPHVATD